MSELIANRPTQPRVGAVVIGRNEGKRLEACLASVQAQCAEVVYVDSGSTDDSVEIAHRLGAQIVELDPTRPFTAARARNTGLTALLERGHAFEYVQFVDGDCELELGWIATGTAALDRDEGLAVAYGRGRERHPEQSPYNKLCDLEWDIAPGPTRGSGGVAMTRISALEQAGRFHEDLIAGEEPELGLRLRALGWRIECQDAWMMIHDAELLSFGQWWRRCKRSGYCYAEVSHRHDGRLWRHEVRRALLWGAVLPMLIAATLIPTHGLSALLLLAYVIPARGAYRWARSRGRQHADAAICATLTVVSRFAETSGVLRFHWGRLLRRPSGLIEHKQVPPAESAIRDANGSSG